jgi:hypothetical protein
MRSLSLVVAIVVVSAFAGSAAAASAGTSSLTVPHGAAPALSQADIARLTQGALQRSIVIFKNQHADVPFTGATKQARVDDVDADQAGVRSELAQLHAPVTAFHIVNAAATSITSAEIEHLRANPEVQAVVPDLQRRFDTATNAPTQTANAAPAAPTPQAICPADPNHPILEPEALQVMHVENQPGDTTPAAHDLVDGTGVKVGIIADGLDPNNPDFMRNGASVIFDYRDFSGFGNGAPTDGREAFLDAGSIASQANETYDLSGFVNPAHPLPPGCNIKIKGIAPGASLAVMNVAGSAPGFFNSQIIQAIEWAVGVDHVNVLNESFGANPVPDTHDDPVSLADQAAVAAGVTVIASTGDSGPFNNIGSPATSPGIINAGGSTTLRVYRQTSRYGTQLVPGGWLNDNITALSSAGTTEFGPRTVDVVAPGDRGWSLCSSDTAQFFGCADIDHGTNPPPIWAAGGTSASAPETSGTAALVIEAYENAHNGAAPSPDLVKRIIVSTATDLGAPADHQGAGLVNALKAVQLAQSIAGAVCKGNGHGNCTPTGVATGNGVLLDRTSLIATGSAGSSASFQVTVTNQGTGPQTVTPGLFALDPTPTSSDTGHVTLSSASPTYIDGEGNTDRYALHTFAVPDGADYLNADIVWDAATTTTAAFETIFDPLGRVAGYSLLGADHSGLGHVEVRQPMAGTWTAVIFTVVNAFVYNGDVNFSFTTQIFAPTGTVSPSSQTLARGQSGTFTVTAAFGPPGDLARTLRISTGASDDGSIPMLLRSLIPLGGNGGSFGGTLTGGASTSLFGQRLSYQFDVSRSVPELNVAVHLQDPNYNIDGFLVDPNGEPLDVQSTAVIDNGSLQGFGNDLQLFEHDPQQGRWTLSLLVLGPIDGTRVSEPYTGSISFAPPPVTATGIPNSPSVKLARGVPVTAQIAVTNSGRVNKDFFVDPRLNGRVLQTLLGSDTDNVPLPLPLDAQPNWLVPTHTDTLAVVAQGTVPIVMDTSYLTGDPDVLGFPMPNNGSAAILQDPEVAPGFFFGLPEAQGPFPDTGVGTASVNLAAVANTNPFDSAVTSDTGDVWAGTVDPTASYTPITLAPGAGGTINVTITPDAPKNTKVRGFIAVDTFNLATDSGDEVALIPYSYQVR